MAKKGLSGEKGKQDSTKKPIYKKWWFWLIIIIIGGTMLSQNGNDSKTATKKTEKDKTEKVASTKKDKKTSESKKIDMALEVPAEVQAGSDSKATITGKTNPKAKVTVGLGISGDSTTADENGDFSLSYEITGEKDKSIKINTSLDGNTKEATVVVKQNSEVLAAAEKKKADDEAAKQQSAAQKEKEASVPTEYKSAMKKAKQYADMMHMSKAGLYEQLTSEYGEKFSAEAAQYAVDNLQVDYKANALAKAKSYQDQMSMSPEGIRDQLVSEHGEKFTQEEADYAIQNLGN